MEKIIISLSKFNNQSGQYYLLRSFEVTRDELNTALVKAQFRAAVEGHYKYEYTVDSQPCTIYVVTPALFDHLTTTVT